MDKYASSQPLDQSALLSALMNLSKEAHPTDWARQLAKLLRQLGFHSYMVRLGAAPVDRNPLTGLITNFPKEWLDRYRCEGLIEIDPILKHCRRELVPMLWDQERRRARGRSQRFWQQRAAHGLGNGISIPLRHEFLRGTLSVAFDTQKHEKHMTFCSENVSRLFVLAPFIVAGLRHQVCRQEQPSCALTPKEMECLHWAGIGKTTWEISRILDCGERTVDFHLLNARQKLGSVNRQQTVGRAAECGLITTTRPRRLRNEDQGYNVAPKT
ncbi:MAG: LuxR family transcriptional regulator [Pseudomonas sp.]|uniref:helix-turn-helix transcriptional regulator n=1 Tax=Pseudomonas sp. TaxID=306 RepID=UPI003D6F9352